MRTISRGNGDTEGTADRKAVDNIYERKHSVKAPLDTRRCCLNCRITGDNADCCTAFICLGFILKQAATKHINCKVRWGERNQEARRLGCVTKGGAGGHRKLSGCAIRASS